MPEAITKFLFSAWCMEAAISKPCSGSEQRPPPDFDAAGTAESRFLCAALLFPFHALELLADFLQLAGVGLGVAGVALEQAEQGPRGILGVGAGALESGFGGRFERIVILGANAAEGFERLFGLAARVIQVSRPGILVEGHQGGVVLGDD